MRQDWYGIRHELRPDRSKFPVCQYDKEFYGDVMVCDEAMVAVVIGYGAEYSV